MVTKLIMTDESTTDEGGSAVQSDLEEEEEESNTTTDSDSIGFFSEAEKQTSIKFLYNGERPCDSLRGYSHPFEYSEHQVACNRTIRELLCELGCPDRNGTGVTEIFPKQHGIFAAGRDFTWNNTETLAEVGWTEHRIGENAVWLAVKR